MQRDTYDSDWVFKATPEALARLWAAIFGTGSAELLAGGVTVLSGKRSLCADLALPEDLGDP